MVKLLIPVFALTLATACGDDGSATNEFHAPTGGPAYVGVWRLVAEECDTRPQCVSSNGIDFGSAPTSTWGQSLLLMSERGAALQTTALCPWVYIGASIDAESQPQHGTVHLRGVIVPGSDNESGAWQCEVQMGEEACSAQTILERVFSSDSAAYEVSGDSKHLTLDFGRCQWTYERI